MTVDGTVRHSWNDDWRRSLLDDRSDEIFPTMVHMNTFKV